ncbi:flippase [Gordonia sp. NPDC003376]
MSPSVTAVRGSAPGTGTETAAQTGSDTPGSGTADDSRRAIGNTAVMLGSRVAIAVMGWAGTVVMARVLSPDDWGKFSFVFGVLGMMSIVTDLGVGRVVLARLVGDDHAEIRSVAASFIALRTTLGLIGYVVAVGFVALSGYPSDVVLATVIAGLVVVLATPSHALTVLFQSRLRLGYVAAGEMLAQSVQLALTVVIALTQPLLLLLVVPAVVNELVSLVVKIRGLRRGLTGPRPGGRPEVWRWKEMLLEAVPLSIGFAFIEVTSKVDVLMLGRLDDFDAVGLYSIGFKFSDFVLVAAAAVITPFTTLLVTAWPGDTEGFRRATRQSVSIVMVLCAGGLAALWPVTRPLLELLYGERFGAASTSTQLLVAAGVMGALSQLGLMVLVAAGRHRVYPWVALVALTINVLGNLWLIPRHSYEGAAWAMLISQLFMLLAVAVVVRMSIPVPRLIPVTTIVGSVAVAALVIVALMAVPGLRSVPWPVAAVLGGVVTVAVIVSSGWAPGVSARSLWRWMTSRRSGQGVA